MHNRTKYPDEKSGRGPVKQIAANRKAALAMARVPKGKQPKRKIVRSR